MYKSKKSNLWMPEIIQINGFLNKTRKSDDNKLSNNGQCFWDLYKKSVINELKDHEKDTCLPLVKSRFLRESKKFFYWNHYPNMIIDIDWFELNRKKPCNIILTDEKKPPFK
jgi:hypothetical protein